MIHRNPGSEKAAPWVRPSTRHPLRDKLKRFDARGKTRNFASSGVLVQNAKLCAARHFRLSDFHRSQSSIFVANVQRSFDLLNVGTNTADTCTINGSTCGVAANALLLIYLQLPIRY